MHQNIILWVFFFGSIDSRIKRMFNKNIIFALFSDNKL